MNELGGVGRYMGKKNVVAPRFRYTSKFRKLWHVSNFTITRYIFFTFRPSCVERRETQIIKKNSLFALDAGARAHPLARW